MKAHLFFSKCLHLGAGKIIITIIWGRHWTSTSHILFIWFSQQSHNIGFITSLLRWINQHSERLNISNIIEACKWPVQHLNPGFYDFILFFLEMEFQLCSKRDHIAFTFIFMAQICIFICQSSLKRVTNKNDQLWHLTLPLEWPY